MGNRCDANPVNVRFRRQADVAFKWCGRKRRT